MLKHSKVSAWADSSDPRKIRASDWNADHAMSGGVNGDLLVRDTAAASGMALATPPWSRSGTTISPVTAGDVVSSPGPGTGIKNEGHGALALTALTTGYDNAAFGYGALGATTEGYLNTAVGARALQSNTTGDYNVAVGEGALYASVTPVSNTAIGTSVLRTLTSGNYNVGVGLDVMEFLQTGTENVAVGMRALWSATATNYNTAIGAHALEALLTGGANIAIGYNSLLANLASGNLAVGNYSMVATTTSPGNLAVGHTSLLNITTNASGYNTAVGNLAGRYQANGSTALAACVNSVYIGYQAMGFDNSDSNTIVIGANAIGAGPNKAVLGNASVTDVYLGSSTAAARLLASALTIAGLAWTPSYGVNDSGGTGYRTLALVVPNA